MITLKTCSVKLFDGSERINVNLKTKIKELTKIKKEYEETVNFEYLECPECHTSNLIYYGGYIRNIGINKEFLSVRIQRVQCKDCNKTHAIIPSFIYPFFQCEKSYINYVLLLVKVREKKEKEIENRLGLTRQLLSKQKQRFKRHETRLKTFFETSEIKEIINEVREDFFESEYEMKNGIRYFQKVPT